VQTLILLKFNGAKKEFSYAQLIAATRLTDAMAQHALKILTNFHLLTNTGESFTLNDAFRSPLVRLQINKAPKSL